MVTIEITGLAELQRTLQTLGQQVERAMVQAMRAEAERVLEASQPLVPVDTGLLRSTGLVRELHDGAEVRYGGFGLAPYSILQHEETSYHHTVGQHHYLSQALFAAMDSMPPRLAQDVAAARRR
jgi:hypothetical protein